MSQTDNTVNAYASVELNKELKASNTLIHPSFSTTVHSQPRDFAITVNDHPIKQTTGYHLTHELGVKMTHNDKSTQQLT